LYNDRRNYLAINIENQQNATVAQPAEQPLRKRRVKGSIPFGGSFFTIAFFHLIE
jgi:hypothetical protein